MPSTVDSSGWARVAEAARQRLTDMRRIGNKRQLQDESGVSVATWRNLLDGKPVKRLDVKARICDYLGWPVDGIDKILAGQKVRASRSRGPDGPRRQEVQLDEIQMQLDSIRRD